MPTPLLSKTPREVAGGKTAARYDYQVHVSILKLLSLHISGSDYRAFFDFYDDLLIVTYDQGAEVYDFYQIKTKDAGSWTGSLLARRPTKADIPKSVYGKMYYNLDLFPASTRCIGFISNAPFQLTLADGSSTGTDHASISFTALATTEKSKLAESLDADFTSPDHSAFGSVLTFEKAYLDLSSYQLTTKGKISECLEALSVENDVVVGPFYKTLHAAVFKRTAETRIFATEAELHAEKSLSRSDISALISAAKSRPKGIYEWWPTLEAELAASGADSISILKLKNACSSYWNTRSQGDANALAISRELRAAIKEHDPAKGSIQSSAATLAAYTSIRVTNATFDATTAAIVELCEHSLGQ